MQVAEFQGVVEPYLIRRFNQQRAITVSAVDPALQAAELYAQIRPALAALEVPKGFTVGVEGELKDSGEANRALFKYMPHCLAAIVALLIWQFNSFRRPLIIVLTIPLIVIGAALGLLVAGAYFDFVAMLGLVSLAGIIINNAIVMIDRIDGERKSGKPLKQVVVDACLLRARPILMTTLTTVCGLLPLLLLGGEFWYAMSAVIIGGLLVGTVLTLGVVPVLYSLAFDFRARGS
jgi:multidrug efflux pump subunit AcrB